MYNKNLPTYKKVLTDRRSKSVELQSHLLTAACMSQVESTRLLHNDPPRLWKYCAGLYSSGSFIVQNLLHESCVNSRSMHDIASWSVGALPTK
jgi:hypothetical protein